MDGTRGRVIVSRLRWYLQFSKSLLGIRLLEHEQSLIMIQIYKLRTVL